MGLLLLLAAQSALAEQSSPIPRVGILSPYAASGSSFQDDIKRGLMDLGHIEGKTVEFESDSRMGEPISFQLWPWS